MFNKNKARMRIFYTVLFTLISLLMIAQTENPSFENWEIKQNQITVSGTANFQGLTADYAIDDPIFNYNEIVRWSSLNQLTGTESITFPGSPNPNVELVSESSDFVDGLRSVQLQSANIRISASVTVFGFTIDTSVVNVAPGLLISGELDLDENTFADQLINGSSLTSLNPFTYPNTGQPIDFQPEKLMGSYKYAGVAGDSAMMVSGLIKNREVVAYVIKRLPNAATWTNFELEYEYLSCAMPDTIISLFCSSNLDVTFDNGDFMVNSSFTGIDGSVLTIDNLRLDTIPPGTFPPIALNDFTTIFENEIATADVVANDDLCSGGAAVPNILSDGSNGSTVLTASDELAYTPNPGFNGTDTVSYYICNGAGLCDTALWLITVNPIPSCIAVDDFRSLPSNGASVFDATANDTDCGTMPSLSVLPVNGVANVESNGFISYSPLVGFVGTDSLSYSICSPLNPSQCSTAKVYYEVITGINDVLQEQIVIKPNPASSFVEIENTGKGQLEISLYSLLGKKLLHARCENMIRLDLSDFNTGIYWLELTKDGSSFTSKLQVNK